MVPRTTAGYPQKKKVIFIMKKYFLTGLVTLLPVAITFWFIHFIVELLTMPFIGIIMLFTDNLTPNQGIRLLSQLLILVALVFLTFFIGFAARKIFFKQIIRVSDRLMIKIPLIRKVYVTSKEIVNSFFSTKQVSFKQVVMLPFPHPGCYCLGLVARRAPLACNHSDKDPLISVFIPTGPNPTTGFLVMTQQSELIYLEMKADEAIKFIVSCGVIQPKAPQ